MDFPMDDDWALGGWQQSYFAQADDPAWGDDQSQTDSATPVIPLWTSQPIIFHNPAEPNPPPPPNFSAESSGASKDSRNPPSREHGVADPEQEFDAACQSHLLVLNPRQLGFLPLLWSDRLRTFGFLVENFFRKKSSADTQFLYKLFNAVRITDFDPSYFRFVGVAWVTDRIMKVDKRRFATLLGIRTIDGSLFHKQGNFPSHGFVEVAPDEARRTIPAEALVDVDFDEIRLFTHEPNNFFRGCGPDILTKCRFLNSRKR
jgi:hypothetical protein